MTSPAKAAAWPSELRFQKDNAELLIRFDDGHDVTIPYELLRVESPSAETKGHGGKAPPPPTRKRHVGVTSADPVGRYVFMRVWYRLDAAGDDVLLDSAAGPNNHTLLRRLGLVPEFNGVGRAGDYWVVTVRPNTPQQLTPWNLTQAGGVAPHGPRHVYAPLSLITFRPPGAGEPENTEVVASVRDCRRRFRPLVDREGCCTHTVGNGVDSLGDYVSIQSALDGLPPEGGKVCVLPGTYA